MVIIIKKLEFISLNINKGASFCHVNNKNKILQDICLLMLGSQKCIGAPPSFNTKDNRIKILVDVLNIEYHVNLSIYIIMELKIRTLELMLWIIKYFIEASASSVLPLIFIRGRNPIKFNSKPIHIVNQWEEDKESKVPRAIIEINKKLEGKNLLFIKGRTISSRSK